MLWGINIKNEEPSTVPGNGSHHAPKENSKDITLRIGQRIKFWTISYLKCILRVTNRIFKGTNCNKLKLTTQNWEIIFPGKDPYGINLSLIT